MTTTLFCMPLKKGKTEAYKVFMQECVRPKKDVEVKKNKLRQVLIGICVFCGDSSGLDSIE